MHEKIQDYQLISLIREEEIGRVYQAVHLPSNTPAMIRQLNPALVDELVLEKIAKTTPLLVGLNHPGICKFYTYVIQEGQLYLISEYIPAATLGQYITALPQPLAKEKIWDIFSQITDAFFYAHTKGVHHLAIHPGNILITAAEKVKVLDFGIAGLYMHQLHNRLAENPELCKVQYISPEHISGKDLDARTDIYSLGVILFELLTRQAAYPSVLSASTVLSKICSHSLPPIKVYTKAFAHSYTMQAILDKATAKNPSYRFQDFYKLKESLLEEKDERETQAIHQLMLEVNNRSQLGALEETSIIKLARRKERIKRISQSLLILSLMAGAIAIGLNLKNAVSSAAAISLNAAPEPTDTVDTLVADAAKPAESTNLPSVPVTSPPSLAVASDGQGSEVTAAIGKENQTNTPQTAVVHAGFSVESRPVMSVSQDQLQHRLEEFYAALQSKEIDKTNGFYAPRLVQFFNESNIDEKKLQKLLLTAWKRTPEDKHEILWDTFQYSQDPDGNYIIEFYMNYVYRRANKNWRKRKIYTQIKMDRNLQIYSMTGD